jgi:hypothetical protein
MLKSGGFISTDMSRSKNDKGARERFYLLPGQGGAAYRRKQRKILLWSVIAGLIVSAIFAAIIYLVNRASL